MTPPTDESGRTIGRAFASYKDFAASTDPGWCKPSDRQVKAGLRWNIRTPDGRVGSLRVGVHAITEHEDGTITVSPSLVMPSGWHGWLRAGVFTHV